MGKDDCGCGKPKPGPLGGGRQPSSSPASLIASSGSYTHVSPNGTRTPHGDLLAARAAAARLGGSVDAG